MADDLVMSPQIAFLKDLVLTAQAGNEAALAKLRIICANAAQQAPPTDLIAMAQCLFHIGIQASQNEASRN